MSLLQPVNRTYFWRKAVLILLILGFSSPLATADTIPQAQYPAMINGFEIEAGLDTARLSRLWTGRLSSRT